MAMELFSTLASDPQLKQKEATSLYCEFPYYGSLVARWSVLLLYEPVRFLAMSVVLTILVLSEWKDKQV